MKLFEPGHIGKLETRNRIVMLPMGTRLASSEGFVTDRLLDYYEERAKGGAGTIIVEVSSIEHPRGNAIHNSLTIDTDDAIPGLKALAGRIKQHGARAAIQIGHAGTAARFQVTGKTPVAPSALKQYWAYQVPRELTIPEIEQYVRDFARSAQRAKEAGFEGVEIHGAHRYLISQFLSSAWNQRRDRYGGDFSNRVRFLTEIITKARERVGTDYPLWCRINGMEEGIAGGTTLSEARQTAALVQGSVNAVSVSAIGAGAKMFTTTSPDIPGSLLPLAKAIKDVVDIPVIGAGRITTDIAEKALETRTVDFIGLGRSLLSDPYLPEKLAKGNQDAIRPCITCLKCYTDAVPIFCSVNARLGNEKERKINPARHPRKCFVAGGGPAGITAAVTAAQMGHPTTLFEKEHFLGGQLVPAAIPPEKREMIEPLLIYLSRQADLHPFDIQLGTALTPQIIAKEKPEIVITATGVKTFTPDIPGIHGPNVVTALDVLAGTPVGDRVAVIGGELVGCETADFLAEKGKQVVILRRGPKMATKIHPARRPHLLERLVRQKVEMRVDIGYEKIVENGVIITDPKGGSGLVEADTVVIAAGYVPNTDLYDFVHNRYPDIRVVNIGDSLMPRGILEAIDGGHQAFAAVH